MPLRLIGLSGTAGYYYCFYLSSCFIFLMQRYKEFLKLPNKMHFNYVFRCIFNVCFICKENSDTLFAFLFSFVAHQGIGP